ncbi:MAG: YeeE/YedE family protein [Alphaproteobacteria bacterium]|nr:YeeE/YedE family protein [Alphaproteobacteria bacterium]
MTLPLYDSGMIAGLLAGILFGYVLEGAGFGSPRKLTAQFALRDWAVFKVMFTAVLVAAIGLWLAEAVGLIGTRAVFTPTLFFWAIALGGALIGAGFALGGYCPGTSTVGLFSGRGDAAVFIIGMILGTVLFAAVFEPIDGLYRAAEGPKGQTLMELTGLPTWVILGALVIMAAGGFALGNRCEQRFGGPLTADEVLAGLPSNRSGPADQGDASRLATPKAHEITAS